MPTTVQGPSWTTVTGTRLPSSMNTWVIPTLRPISPSFMAMATFSGSALSVARTAQMRGARLPPTEAYV